MDGDCAHEASMFEKSITQFFGKRCRHVLKYHPEHRRKALEQAFLMDATPFTVGESCHEESFGILPTFDPDQNIADGQLHVTAGPLNDAC